MMQAKATSFVFIALAALLLAAAPARAQEYNYNRVLQLDGSGGFIDVLSPPAVGPAMTVEAWIKTSVATGDQVIISSEVASLDMPLSRDSYLTLKDGGHLTVQNGSSLTPSSGLTIEVWVRSVSSGGALQSVVSKYRHNSNSNTDDAYFLGIEPNGVARFQISIGSNFHLLRGSTNLLSGDLCPDLTNPWHHLAGVFDGSELRLYVNGRLEARSPFSGSMPSNSTPLLIGASQEGTSGVVSDFFQGYLDNVQIWNIALTEFDIHCDAGSGNTNCKWRVFPQGSLVTEWRFEEDFINLVNYRSGNPRFWGTPVGRVSFCRSGSTCLGAPCI